jgi:hypothetical protein
MDVIDKLLKTILITCKIRVDLLQFLVYTYSILYKNVSRS